MASESLAQSPFDIPHEDVNALCASEGFQVLRRYLSQSAEFCPSHAQYCDQQEQDTWLLHRDLLHALIMPVVQLYRRAASLAQAALCTNNSADLELAFSGEARGAFLCLQCFITEEGEWCQTRACPACVTTATLSTESHIRFTIAASLLSTASIPTPTSSAAASPSSSPQSSHSSDQIPATRPNRTLPPLPHILPALRKALSADPFWGPSHWSYMLSRATQLSNDIQSLITECTNLESLVASPVEERASPTTLAAKRSITLPGLRLQISSSDQEAPEEQSKGVKLRKSKLAKRQLRLREEETDIMRRCVLQCWAKAAIPTKVRAELLGKGEGRRARSLTCP